MSKTQSAISTKLFLALGFITITAIVAGIASILALNRFQDNFNALINSELPTLEDTANIRQLSVAIANRGANFIVSPNTWNRENLIAQVDDDAQWLDEILARVSDRALSGHRKRELLALKTQLLDTYSKLNTLTQERITYAKRLDDIDRAIRDLQQTLINGHFAGTFEGKSLSSESRLHPWSQTAHDLVFTLMEAHRLTHSAPLTQLEGLARESLADLRGGLPLLPSSARAKAEDTLSRLDRIVNGHNNLFAVKAAALLTEERIEASLRSTRTLAERFISASELAARDIRAAIIRINQDTSRGMNFTLQAMVGFILVSALVAVATFLYVSRTVLNRLGALRKSMLAHAEGADANIDTSGDDEITDMAQSLQYLVDTLRSREAGLTQAKEEAERASTAKTRFLAAASHDLRQPLQALNLFVYALEGKEKDEDKREIIHLIRNSLDSLKELLNTLLDISKLEAGVVQANMKDFAAGPMIERIKSELTAVAWASDLEFRAVASGAIVHSDPSLLETMVRNLVDNAIKYTERGKVLIGCRRRHGQLRIEVWDTGPGIPADQRELIFQDFYQIRNEARKRSQGLGLGLSIVKRMTALLGCVMGCDSTPGKGSVFWIEVPLSYADQPVERRIEPRADIEAAARAAAHIVVVEDDEHVLSGLKALLEAHGFTTMTFPSVNRAIIEGAFAARQRRPDMIIADYRLGEGLTGGDAITMIRDVLGGDIPAIIITGDTAPERLREAKKSGLPILHKPVRPEELLNAIRIGLGEEEGVARPESSRAAS